MPHVLRQTCNFLSPLLRPNVRSINYTLVYYTPTFNRSTCFARSARSAIVPTAIPTFFVCCLLWFYMLQIRVSLYRHLLLSTKYIYLRIVIETINTRLAILYCPHCYTIPCSVSTRLEVMGVAVGSVIGWLQSCD